MSDIKLYPTEKKMVVTETTIPISLRRRVGGSIFYGLSLVFLCSAVLEGYLLAQAESGGFAIFMNALVILGVTGVVASILLSLPHALLRPNTSWFGTRTQTTLQVLEGKLEIRIQAHGYYRLWALLKRPPSIPVSSTHSIQVIPDFAFDPDERNEQNWFFYFEQTDQTDELMALRLHITEQDAIQVKESLQEWFGLSEASN